MDLHSLIEPLIKICDDAGKAIMQVYNNEQITIVTKQDNSPVTQADLAAHEIIKDGLARLTPDIPQLSEEDVPHYSERQHWTRFWCIDPLDGTKEFVNRNGEFTINIALIENHQPIFGIISVPVSGTTYWGGPQTNAWKQLPNQAPAQIRSRPLGPDLIISASRRHGQDDYHDLLNPIEHKFVHVSQTRMGSSLKMCQIAEGAADFYPRLFPTSEWDTAAAQAIVEAAGGRIVDVTNLHPLRYNKQETLINPFFYVCGDPQFPLEELRLG